MKGQAVVKGHRSPRFGFVRGVASELKKVAWPSRQEAIRLTIIVIIVTVAVALMLGLVDYAFSKFVDTLLIE